MQDAKDVTSGDAFAKAWEARREIIGHLRECQKAEHELAKKLRKITLDGLRTVLERAKDGLTLSFDETVLPKALSASIREYRQSLLHEEFLRATRRHLEEIIQTLKVETKTNGLLGGTLRMVTRDKGDAGRERLRRAEIVLKDLSKRIREECDRRQQLAEQYFRRLLACDEQDSRSGLLLAALKARLDTLQRVAGRLDEGVRSERDRIAKIRRLLDELETRYPPREFPHG